MDVEAGVASPLGVPELAHWRVPLAPMIGCFDVAPERHQAISTATSERHGGNMDWNGFQAGVTALFPVFEPGALFALGDDDHPLPETLGPGGPDVRLPPFDDIKPNRSPHARLLSRRTGAPPSTRRRRPTIGASRFRYARAIRRRRSTGIGWPVVPRLE